MDNGVTCYNRDTEGHCLAFTSGNCSWECSARIKTVEDKIRLLHCLLSVVQNKKDSYRLKEELKSAYQTKAARDSGKMEGWMGCYLDDLHRGEKGGASESDANARTSMKQLMKDNRPVGIKPTKEQLQEYKEELGKWEESNEKLERLGRTGMTHSKTDSYTGEKVCFIDDGAGTCHGIRGCKGRIPKECMLCDSLCERIKLRELEEESK